jgi:xylose isomerase
MMAEGLTEIVSPRFLEQWPTEIQSDAIKMTGIRLQSAIKQGFLNFMPQLRRVSPLPTIGYAYKTIYDL